MQNLRYLSEWEFVGVGFWFVPLKAGHGEGGVVKGMERREAGFLNGAAG